MNREQIIQMAREADLIYWRPYANFKDGIWWMDEGEPDERLERFAKLVAEHERSECLKFCDQVAEYFPSSGFVGSFIGSQIRDRGQA